MKSMHLGRLLVGAAVMAGFLMVPSESHAIFNWFGNCCGNKTPTYGTAPLYSAAAPADPCCTPPQVQTVNYVPQTCYRTQYVNVPVTTYRPAIGRDPCTGCPVTAMRPTVTMVQQARLVPYTTYRMVMSNPCCGAAAPATAVGYAPAYSSGLGYAPPASACCGATSAAPITYSPPASTPYYGSSTIVGSSSNAAATQPTPAASGSSPSRTFKDSSSTLKLEKPIQAEEKEPADESSDSDVGADKGAGLTPRLFQPNDRTTSYPILRVNVHRPVSYRELHAPPAADGWRPATR